MQTEKAGCGVLMRFGTLVHGEHQENVPRHASKPRVARIDEDTSAYDNRTSAIERAPFSLNAIHSLIFSDGIEIPNKVAIVGREGPQMPVV
jgi:hypothetical protein